MEEKYKRAFTEVYEILKIMPNEVTSKIPQKMKEIIEKERDINYNVTIKKPLNIQDFQYETIVFLGMIYRDFLCSEEERKELQEKEVELIKKYDEQLEEQYNIDNIFKKRQKAHDEEPQNLPIEVKEEKWYKKLINFFKRFF